MLNKPAAFIKLTPLAKKYNKAERQTHCDAWKKKRFKYERVLPPIGIGPLNPPQLVAVRCA